MTLFCNITGGIPYITVICIVYVITEINCDHCNGQVAQSITMSWRVLTCVYSVLANQFEIVKHINRETTTKVGSRDV